LKPCWLNGDIKTITKRFRLILSPYILIVRTSNFQNYLLLFLPLKRGKYHIFNFLFLQLKIQDMFNGKTLAFIASMLFVNLCFAQDVPILSYSVNNYGQVELEIEGEADKYYTLTAEHEQANTTNLSLP